MIWIALIVPLIGAGILFVWFREKLTWWELLIPLGACLIFTFIFKLTVETVQTSDTEYWGDLGVRAEYYEYWSTWVDRTCSRQVACGTETDSKGHTRTKYCTEYYDCSYCDENPAHWELVTRSGKSYSISESKYRELMARWNSQPTFKDLRRRIDKHWRCGEDGDMYYVTWNGDPYTSEPTSSSHRYENRVQAAHTAFDFPEITIEEKKLYNLHDYGEVKGYYQNCLLGLEKVKWVSQAERDTLTRMLSYINGDLGPKKELRTWVLVFQDQPELAASMQEALWKGGNKNEMVICLGLSSKTNKLQWVKAFSWTPNRALLVNLREDLMETERFSSSKITEVLKKDLPAFERKHFREFSYITVDPPMWAIWVTFIVTLLVAAGCCYWAVVNEFEADKLKPWKTVTRWSNGWKKNHWR
jgi:hypothetical protein